MKSAFLMHPLDLSYIQRSRYMAANIWASFLPDRAIEYIIRQIDPYIQSRFSIIEDESMIVVCPLTSKQMIILPKQEVLGKLEKACNIANEDGAEIISLGAYSSIASNHGLDLAGKVNIGLTTGRAYTVYAVLEQAKRYIEKNSRIAIVGCDGSIGSAVSRLMENYDITKINRDNIDDIYLADIVVSASSDLNEVINPDKLKAGAVVIDAAKPSDISRKIKRKDIRIIDGGIVRIPGDVDLGIDFDCSKNRVYACMAEAFILGMAGKKGNYCIGKDIPLEKVEEIGRLGEELGFEVVR